MSRSVYRILVVDDEQFHLKAIAGALRSDIYVTELVDNGSEALQVCPVFKPDIIVLDVLMPNMDGIETCKRLRAMPCARDIPILILTGRADSSYISKAYAMGATDYLLKPINWLIFKQRVASSLREYEVRKSLEEKQDELDLTQKTSHVGSIKVDGISHKIETSAHACEMLGLPHEQSHLSFDTLLQLVDDPDRAHYKFSIETAIKEKATCRIEFNVSLANGEHLILFQQCEYFPATGDVPPYLLGSIQDVTQSRRAHDAFEDKRYSDDVTHLPNKRFFKLEIEHVLQNPPTDSLFAVVFIGLDKFSRINDILGHAGGDRVLQIVAKRLHNYESDGHIACRFSGDVFTMLINNLSHINICNQILEDLLELLKNEIVIDDETFFLTASIGASVFPLESEKTEALLIGAEAAMMQSREAGGDCYTYRTVDMNRQTHYRNNMLKEMRTGLMNNEFLIYYQPLIDAKTLKVVGMEALARWMHPKRGIISPVLFIPLAEESGLIIGLGEKVLRQACADTRRWNAMGFKLCVSVNLSAQQFEMDKICQLIEHILEEEQLEPHYLEVEITESMAVTNYVETAKKLQQLRLLGIKISMDDFGTGYSSLSQLQEIPLDTLKVDQAFVRCINYDAQAQGDQRYKKSAIANAIIAMSHSMGLTVIAEGVETEDQCRFLQEKGSDILQGFLFSKPIPADEFENLILQQSRELGSE